MKNKYATNVLPNLGWIESWARNGVCEKQMAKNLHVAYSTWNDYKLKHPELAEILARTRDYVDLVEMEGAYKRRAEGYTTQETKRVYAFVPDPVTGEVTRQLVQEIVQDKHVPGDPRAMENWLRLRQREKWGTVIVDEEAGHSGIVLIPDTEQLEEPDTGGDSDE